ncbi:hypothetical protein EXIGLDRAFT_737331 [Exidia glandulosa HHB12029]|uniref:Uncharacterized protein n=1 Tax=Exidia glandulosa HHB12029 TaxID=1314781 RepID=A0A165J1I6_EXIGL|nr:hypothetical protein EXIGLDRAFT_737331 [Exidia glandulosa HHB12029]
MSSSQHTPDDVERARNAGDGDGPELIYRSNNLPTPFPKPAGIFSQTPIIMKRSMYPVGGTPPDTRLEHCWYQVRSSRRSAQVHLHQHRALLHLRSRRLTRNPDPANGDTLGPVTIWIGVRPGSTSADIAHDASQLILALLRDHDIEWTDAVLERL